MNHERATALAERLLEAWNSQDVDRVLACYTPAERYARCRRLHTRHARTHCVRAVRRTARRGA
jgi:hypothetical protein